MNSQRQGKGLGAKHTFEGKQIHSCLYDYTEWCQINVALPKTVRQALDNDMTVVTVLIMKLMLCFSVLKELTMKVLNCMSGFISLPAIIQQILQVCICDFLPCF